MQKKEFLDFLEYTLSQDTASLAVMNDIDEVVSFQTILENNEYILIPNMYDFLLTIDTHGKYYVILNEENINPMYSLVKQFGSGQIYNPENGKAIIPNKEGSLVILISKNLLSKFENEQNVSFRSICGLIYQLI